MRCPHCGVHYMDNERVCPICGKPAGSAAKRNSKYTTHPPKTTLSSPKTKASHKTPSSPKTPHEHIPKTSTSAASRPSGWTSSNKRSGKGVGCGLIIAVLVIISIFFSMAGSVLHHISDADSFFDNVIDNFEEAGSSDYDYEDTNDAITYAIPGTWHSKQTGMTLCFDSEICTDVIPDGKKNASEITSLSTTQYFDLEDVSIPAEIPEEFRDSYPDDDYYYALVTADTDDGRTYRYLICIPWTWSDVHEHIDSYFEAIDLTDENTPTAVRFDKLSDDTYSEDA